MSCSYKDYAHLYKTSRWQQMRWLQLSNQPICSRCIKVGIVTVATVVNHIKPHKGNHDLFFSFENFESVCKPCHDGVIQREERGRFKAVGSDGWGV